MHQANQNNSEDESLSEKLSDVERSISLCTLCEEETKLLSESSSIFLSSLPRIEIEESIECSSYESASANIADDFKPINCITENCDEPESTKISPYFHQQVFSTIDLADEICPPSKYFLELMQKSALDPDRCRPKKPQQPLGKDSQKFCFFKNNKFSPKSNIFCKRDVGIENFNLSADKACQIFTNINADNLNVCPNDYPAEISTQIIETWKEQINSPNEKTENKHFNEIFFSGTSDDEKITKKMLTQKDDFSGTSSTLVFTPEKIREEIDLAISQRDDNNGEKKDTIIVIEHLEKDDKKIDVEAPRIYTSDITDDEIPRKKAKIIEDQLISETLSVMELPTVPENFLQPKRIILSEKTTNMETEKEIPHKRAKIVDIVMVNEPIRYFSRFNHESAQNLQELPLVQTLPVKQINAKKRVTKTIIQNSGNPQSEESKFSEPTNELSPSFSSEIPIASELTIIGEFSLPQFDTNREELAQSENYVVLKDAGITAEKAKSSKEPHDHNQLTTKPASSKNYVILQNTKAAIEEIEGSKLAQVNTDTNNDLVHTQNLTKLRNKKIKVPEENERVEEENKEHFKPEVRNKITSQRIQRNSLDSWNEIENAFVNPKDKKSLPCNKKKCKPLIAISPPDLKRLQNKINKQRQSTTNTLKNLRNLSCYMDRVRETLFAEDDSNVKPLYQTVSNINESTIGRKSKIMISTGTQTMMKNSPVEASTIKALDVGTQTEDIATEILIKTSNTPDKKKLQVDNAMKNCNSLVKKPPKLRKTRKLLDIDRATARAHEALFNATFEEFRCNKRV